jgi:signal transduction histidine kinase
MRRFRLGLPQTLAWQLISLLLLALVAAQIATFAILRDERRVAIASLAREQVLERAAALVRLAETSDNRLERRRALRALSSSQLRFWLGDAPVVEGDGSTAPPRLLRELDALLGDGRSREVRIILGEVKQRPPEATSRWHAHWRRATEAGLDMGEPPARLPAEGLLLAIRLAPASDVVDGGGDEAWLNGALILPPAPLGFGPAALVMLVVAALAISVVAALTVRRLTRPLDALARAADAVGQGQPAVVEAASGPLEIRQTAAAFNAMQERIGRAMTDRNRLLAAISHDLRTPITTLRLRAEMVDDASLRTQMLRTLQEMQALTEAGLTLARDTGNDEPTRAVDLRALIDSVLGDFADQGRDVMLEPGPAVTIHCRKLAMTRAIRNLVDNAVRYGGRAVVTIEPSAGRLVITIDDAGPGVPDASLEQIFEPFFRLEASRSQETGGSGLGLAIARSIVRGHGGEVKLANRPAGGLRASVVLPGDASERAAARDI